MGRPLMQEVSPQKNGRDVFDYNIWSVVYDTGSQNQQPIKYFAHLMFGVGTSLQVVVDRGRGDAARKVVALPW